MIKIDHVLTLDRSILNPKEGLRRFNKTFAKTFIFNLEDELSKPFEPFHKHGDKIREWHNAFGIKRGQTPVREGWSVTFESKGWTGWDSEFTLSNSAMAVDSDKSVARLLMYGNTSSGVIKPKRKRDVGELSKKQERKQIRKIKRMKEAYEAQKNIRHVKVGNETISELESKLTERLVKGRISRQQKGGAVVGGSASTPRFFEKKITQMDIEREEMHLLYKPMTFFNVALNRFVKAWMVKGNQNQVPLFNEKLNLAIHLSIQKTLNIMRNCRLL